MCGMSYGLSCFVILVVDTYLEDPWVLSSRVKRYPLGLYLGKDIKCLYGVPTYFLVLLFDQQRFMFV